MTAISVTRVGQNTEGKELVRAVIMADAVPDPLPLTGDGITGMTANQMFAPFSVLFITGDVGHKVFLTGETGEFIQQ